MFEILEEKIDQVVEKMESLSEENATFKKVVEEKEEIIKSAQDRIDALEEEKTIIKSKVEGILRKINQALG
ncbi:MAG TPA: cell division protein ZapB [Thermodesulfobacteriota bacterium]|nr:cell division protein ZapB [Thermodesulfobacteriota bacterium]